MTSFGYRLNPCYAIKECSSCGALYTEDFCCSKGNVEDKILVPKLPKNYARYARCGHLVDGPYCHGCALFRKKLEEDLVTYFKDFQNTSESSDDSTNIVNAPREPFVVKQDHGVNSSQNPPHIDECCYECGDALDGIFCQQCTCKSCGKGFDQNQPPQFPVIHPPPQETSIEILHDQENAINSVQTFLKKFNHYSFFKTPKVLLLAWDRVFETKDAFGNKQYKPEDIQELFHKLFNDVQNIHEELAKYINTPGWNQSNEVIKSIVEDLVPIPSESEGSPDTMCDVHLVNNPTPLEAKDHFEIVINSNDEYSSSDDDSLYNENIEYVEASPYDSELVSLEVAEIVISEDEEIEDDNLREKLLNVNLLIAKIETLKDNPTPSSEFLTKPSSTSPKSFLEETNIFDNSLPEFENFCFDLEEISSGSTTTHYDISLSEYDSCIFDLSNDQFPPTDRSDFTHEEFADELAHIISPLEYDCFYFRNLLDPGEWISILNFEIHENLSSTTRVNLPVEDDHSPLLAYVIWILLAYLTYPVIPPYPHSFENEDTIFDPGIAINRFYSFKMGLSHRCGTFKKFNTHRSHLNESSMEIDKSKKFSLKGWSIPLLHCEYSPVVSQPDNLSRTRLGSIENMLTKEQLEEEENKAIQSINETPTQKAAKKRKLNEKVEDLKWHLEIVPDEDDDVYTEATPLARKVPVVDYEIIHLNNKPHYKMIRADGTHQLPDGQAQVWKNQMTIHGQAKVKSWKLLESYGVHIITFTNTQLILLVERRYSLSRFTLDKMLNAVRLRVEDQSEMSLELLRVESSGDEESLGEDASKQGRWVDVINADDEITLVNDADNEMFDVDDLSGEEVFIAEREVVSTATITETITTEEITLAQVLEALKTSKPKVKGIVFQEPSKSTTTTTTISSQQSQDKGKGIMIEEPVKPKKKDQIMLDEEAVKRLQARFDEEEILARERAEK
nr:hypothetical protein [Tanacetum cinerariifolium]